MKQQNSIRFSSLMILTLLFLGIEPLHSQQLGKKPSTPKPIVVLVEKVHDAIQYRINSVIVEHPLLELSKMESKYGENYPVIAIVDSRLPIEMVGSVEGMAIKAQLLVTRSFIYDVNGNSMAEIKFGKWLPFSQSPPVK